MGAGSTKVVESRDPVIPVSNHSSLSRNPVVSSLQKMDDKYPPTPYQNPLASPEEIHHYMPVNFPMLPVINAVYVSECNKTWKLICTANTNKMKGYGKQGIVLFYDEFFHRLFQRDYSIENVFVDVKKQSEVLIKAMTFMLKAASDDPCDVANRSRHLGHYHRSVDKVRPYHFASYVSTMVEVIMYWLGDHATPDIGEAWSNVVGFYTKYIMQGYLWDNTNPSEFIQNTTSGNNLQELQNK